MASTRYQFSSAIEPDGPGGGTIAAAAEHTYDFGQQIELLVIQNESGEILAWRAQADTATSVALNLEHYSHGKVKPGETREFQVLCSKVTIANTDAVNAVVTVDSGAGNFDKELWVWGCPPE